MRHTLTRALTPPMLTPLPPMQPIVFKQLYQDEKVLESDSYTVYTNLMTGGAMRGYGIPQEIL